MLGSRDRLFAIVIASVLAVPAMADDRHAGYYYPVPESFETYTARLPTLQDSDRTRRIGFVTVMTQQLLAADYAPSFAVFAKGDEAEKLIIVGLVDGQLNTLFRVRALLANLTAISRLTPFFRETGMADHATFLDLLKLLGFQQITVTDGIDFAHQVRIE